MKYGSTKYTKIVQSKNIEDDNNMQNMGNAQLH